MTFLVQGLNISPQQQRWVVDHMGHTLDVHNIHYKSTLDVIERVDISKLLLMMDLGQIGRFKGKRLDEIQFEGMSIILLQRFICHHHTQTGLGKTYLSD